MKSPFQGVGEDRGAGCRGPSLKLPDLFDVRQGLSDPPSRTQRWALPAIHHRSDSRLGQGRLQIGEPNPDYHLVPAPDGDDDCYSVGFYCADADALVARAERSGATVREPLSTFVPGDRYASIRDPYGVRWSIMTRVEDLSEEESVQRVADWASKQG